MVWIDTSDVSPLMPPCYRVIGVIKGSEETLNSGKRYLDKASYIGLSARTYSTFATMRETVYQLFEEYKARQQILRHVDIADR